MVPTPPASNNQRALLGKLTGVKDFNRGFDKLSKFIYMLGQVANQCRL